MPRSDAFTEQDMILYKYPKIGIDYKTTNVVVCH